jgi:ATP-dependent helicase HrpB
VTPARLPIHEVLPELLGALTVSPNAVLVAPPGAGKTTMVPLALLDQAWAEDGRIVVLEPRRLAARAAAARMAATLGERVGETVGFHVRMQSQVSARTRIEVVTEGVFTRMILDDPGLEDVAAILFDEFHERSLDADLGLALALDAQALLRPELRLLVMSATLDGARVARLLGQAPVIESEGRAHPVETRYLGRDPRLRVEDQVARAVRRALAEEHGSVLAFLPGQGEIRRAAERLEADIGDPAIMVAPLFGALTPAEQDAAIAPAPPGRRKVVLATSIAETSLTIEGVRVVVDSGLARVPRYSPPSGLTRLETVRVSRAAADQRRGRAGRTEPGVCYRLWEEPETRSLVPFGAPEILDSDLSRLALDLAVWGARDPAALAFLNPPPAGAFAEGQALLRRLGALDDQENLTEHGRRIARLALPPRLAHMLVLGAERGAAERAALIAALLTERGLGGMDAHLGHRLDAFARDRSRRAEDARALAQRWVQSARRRDPSRAAGRKAGEDDGVLLAAAYPERIAKARGKPGEFRLASGRGAFVDPADPLAREAWIAVGELGSGEARDRILLAAPLDPADLSDAFAELITTEDRLDADARGRVTARRLVRLGELTLEEREVAADPALVRRALLDRVRREGLSVLPTGEALHRLRARVAFLKGLDPERWPDLSDAALLEHLDNWLAPLLDGRTSLTQLRPEEIEAAVRGLLDWEQARDLDRLAPERFEAPTGSRMLIDYAAEVGPRVDIRVQELFGISSHPTVAEGRAPLTLALLSPAHRPVQLTRDLPGFWRGSYAEVRMEMKGRYPKHPWPENPAEAAPTTRAKPRKT